MLDFTIKCNDCLEELRKLKDNSVDLIVTDPPYIMEDTSLDRFILRPAYKEIYR